MHQSFSVNNHLSRRIDPEHFYIYKSINFINYLPRSVEYLIDIRDYYEDTL